MVFVGLHVVELLARKLVLNCSVKCICFSFFLIICVNFS